MKKIIFTGNLGKDPELKLDNNGTHFATFSVAINVKNKKNQKNDWIDVSCNGKLAEIICTYAKKGTKVLVEGYPYASAYINKENIPVGQIKVYANIVELLNKIDSIMNEEINSTISVENHIINLDDLSL